MSRLILNESAITVSTLANLTALDDSFYPNGAIASVTSLLDTFYLNKNSTLTIDGITVIATHSGTGRWVRIVTNNPEWSKQANWYIDPALGNDENVGSDSKPIKTLAEWYRRIGTNIISVNMKVYILSDMPITAPLVSGEVVIGDGFLTITGELGLKTVYSGTITSVTACDPATNTPWSITDSAMPSDGYWSNYVDITASANKRIKIVGGANDGNICWAAKDLNADGYAKTCRVSQPSVPNYAANYLVSYGSISVGDNYVIESMPILSSFDLSIKGITPFTPLVTGISRFTIRDLKVHSSISWLQFKSEFPTAYYYSFYNCELRSGSPAGNLTYVNCKFTRMIQYFPSRQVNYFGGLYIPSSSTYQEFQINYPTWIDFRMMFQSSAIAIYNNVSNISSLQMYQCPTYQGIGIWQQAGAFFKSFFAPQEIFGKDNAGVGIRIQPGAIAQYYPDLSGVTITGNSAQIALGYRNIFGENHYSVSDMPLIQTGQSIENGVTKIISLASFIEV